MYIPEGKENCTTTLGSTLAILQNVKMLTWPSNYIPVHVAKRNEKYVHEKTCTQMFTAALFIIYYKQNIQNSHQLMNI